MKKVCTYLLCALGMQLITVGISNAQEAALALKVPAKPIVIDGSVKEWGDSLSYYNAETKIHYAITNDKYNLYLALKTIDPVQQNNILSSGVTFAVDPKGRKKSAFSVAFPLAGTEGNRRPDNSLEAKKLRAEVSQYRKMGVRGFNDIADNEINATNGYGIAAAMSFDENGYLVYEEVIPLDLFHAGDPNKNEWAFNIKLNEVSNAPMDRPIDTSVPAFAGAGRAGSRASGAATGRVRAAGSGSFGGGQPAQEESKAIDFWGKFSLAKAQ